MRPERTNRWGAPLSVSLLVVAALALPGCGRCGFELAAGPADALSGDPDARTGIFDATEAADAGCAGAYADSVAQYSTVQGQDGWRYGYYVSPFSADDFVELVEVVSSPSDGDIWVTAGDSHWTFVGAERMHPNGTVTTGGVEPVEHRAVRRWTSDRTGPARIHGVVQLVSGTNTNGVTARVLVDGSERWSRYIAPTEASVELPYDLGATLAPGTIIDFQVDPFESNDATDKTLFRAAIDCP